MSPSDRSTSLPEVAAPSGRLVVHPARLEDAPTLLALREAASAWLSQRGIQQWRAGEVSLAEVLTQVRTGEWHVARDQQVIAAAVRLLWQDEQFWGAQPPTAAYLHGLVIDRRYAGQRQGAALLAWAEQQARAVGRSLLRLDCAEDNPALRRYYTDQGFRVVGRRDFDTRWNSVVLLEKAIRQ